MANKKRLVAGGLITVFGTFSLIGGDALAQNSQVYEQANTYRLSTQERTASQHHTFLEQAKDKWHNKRPDQLEDFNDRFEKNTSTHIKAGQNDIETYHNNLLSDIEQEKEAIQATMLNTYKQNKQEEINHQTTKAVQELLN